MRFSQALNQKATATDIFPKLPTREYPINHPISGIASSVTKYSIANLSPCSYKPRRYIHIQKHLLLHIRYRISKTPHHSCASTQSPTTSSPSPSQSPTFSPYLNRPHLLNPKTPTPATTPTIPNPKKADSNKPCLLTSLLTTLYLSFPKLTLAYCVRHPSHGHHTSTLSSMNFRSL